MRAGGAILDLDPVERRAPRESRLAQYRAQRAAVNAGSERRPVHRPAGQAAWWLHPMRPARPPPTRQCGRSGPAAAGAPRHRGPPHRPPRRARSARPAEHPPPVATAALAGHPALALQPIQQPRHARRLLDHPLTHFEGGQPVLARAAQDSQHVELLQRQPVRLENRLEVTAHAIGCLEEAHDALLRRRPRVLRKLHVLALRRWRVPAGAGRSANPPVLRAHRRLPARRPTRLAARVPPRGAAVLPAGPAAGPDGAARAGHGVGAT